MKTLTPNQRFTIAICFNRINEMRTELNSGGPYWLKSQIKKWILYATSIRLTN
jgi:hypothetical protein